jgi:hypothetical protein
MYRAMVLIILMAANVSEAFLTSRWTSGALPSSSVSTSSNADRVIYHLFKSMSQHNSVTRELGNIRSTTGDSMDAPPRTRAFRQVCSTPRPLHQHLFPSTPSYTPRSFR